MIEWASETLTLLPEKALLWPSRATLLVADVHVGKPAAFRRAGVPVPEGATARDLERLSALVREHDVQRLVVLGDLLHARAGRTADVLAAFVRWRAAHASLDVILVRGNHDWRAGDPPADWRVRCVDEPWLDTPFALCHHPHAAPDGSRAIAGHVHPGVRLRGPAGATERCPCFVLGTRLLLLPAFGSFTGLQIVRPRRGERLFAVGREAVVEITRRVRPVG